MSGMEKLDALCALCLTTLATPGGQLRYDSIDGVQSVDSVWTLRAVLAAKTADPESWTDQHSQPITLYAETFNAGTALCMEHMIEHYQRLQKRLQKGWWG